MDWETSSEALQSTLDELAHLSINPSRLTVHSNSELGIGGYGEVCLATLDGSSQVAVKQLRIVQAQGTRVRVAVRLAREMKIWARAKHPNVLELLGYYLSENYVCAQLVSPYMAHGNVTEYIKRTQADLGVRLGFVEGITSGMAYLHSCSPPICHGDLKPANVLVSDEPNAVLCDFGLATFVEGSEAVSGLTTSRSIKGSTRYMGPELFLDIQAKHTLESDVWGWGCTIFEIITDCIPYSSVPSNAHVMLAMVQGQPPGLMESLPKVDMPFRPTLDVLQNLIPDCWNNNPTKRPPSSHIILQLPIISHPQANPNVNTNGNEEPGDGDNSRTYCYCDRVSYGEMIGCDDDQCQREWFHFGCLGMTTPPKGEWFCDECKARREKEKARKGKEKARKEKKRARRTSFELEEVRPVIPAQPHDFKRAVKRARTSSLLEVVANRSTGPNKYGDHHHGFASSPTLDSSSSFGPIDRIQAFKNAPQGFEISYRDVPRLEETGWNPEMEDIQKPQKGPHHEAMARLLHDLQNHALAWPFLRPVSEDDVPDYYHVIKKPMDFSTMEDKLESNKYPTFNDFVEGAMLAFSSCKKYNNEHSVYARNATKMEKFVKEWVQTERSKNDSIGY